MKQTFNEKLNIPNWISLDEVCKISENYILINQGAKRVLKKK